jgi:signal transduction histidine kinase
VSIGQRIASLVVLAVVACMTLFATYNLRARRAELFRQATIDTDRLGATLDVALNELLVHRPLSELSHLPEEISRGRRNYGLAIFDLETGSLVTSRNVSPRHEALRELAQQAARSERAFGREFVLDGANMSAYAFPLRRGPNDVIGAGVVMRDLAYMERLLAASRRRITNVAIALSILVVLVVLAVSRQTVQRPVAALIGGVRRIGEGDLTHPIAVRRHDEIGRIAEALNQMMVDLAAAREQIKRDVEARIQLEKSVELERRLQHAQRLAAVGQIAASLAHEIGSPLHVIAGRARYAAGRSDVNELRENLLVIATQADRITRVVEQLLSVARHRTPRMELVSLAATARTVVGLLEPQARQQHVTLALEERAAHVHASGDPDALQQVLFNLVMNALQAQPKGGRVEVVLDSAVERDSLDNPRQRLVVEVRDRGPGVPLENRESIFEPFATTKEGTGGTGLGLAVVRHILREHAGAVRVTDNPGGGAVFRVTLPSPDEYKE